MIKKSFRIISEKGIHARPATEISKEAMKYKSDIKFVVNGKTLNAKSPLMIMAAGIKSKTELEILCDGEDEKKAIEKLKEAFVLIIVESVSVINEISLFIVEILVNLSTRIYLI